MSRRSLPGRSTGPSRNFGRGENFGQYERGRSDLFDTVGDIKESLPEYEDDSRDSHGRITSGQRYQSDSRTGYRDEQNTAHRSGNYEYYGADDDDGTTLVQSLRQDGRYPQSVPNKSRYSSNQSTTRQYPGSLAAGDNYDKEEIISRSVPNGGTSQHLNAPNKSRYESSEDFSQSRGGRYRGPPISDRSAPIESSRRLVAAYDDDREELSSIQNVSEARRHHSQPSTSRPMKSYEQRAADTEHDDGDRMSVRSNFSVRRPHLPVSSTSSRPVKSYEQFTADPPEDDGGDRMPVAGVATAGIPPLLSIKTSRPVKRYEQRTADPVDEDRDRMSVRGVAAGGLILPTLSTSRYKTEEFSLGKGQYRGSSTTIDRSKPTYGQRAVNPEDDENELTSVRSFPQSGTCHTKPTPSTSRVPAAKTVIQSDAELPKRGPYVPIDTPEITSGEFGEEITVGTNYVPISLVQGAALYVYNICQEPHLNDKKLVSFILHKHEDDLGQIFICNGGNVISPTPFRSKELIYTDQLSDGSSCETKIKFLKKATLMEYPFVLNMLARRVLSYLNLIEIGRRLYDPTKKSTIKRHDLEIWRGYDCSVKFCDDGTMLCCDTVHSVLRLNSVLQMMDGMLADLKSKRQDSQFQNRLKSFFIGCTVLTRYNNKSYKIDGIDFNNSPRSEFQYRGQTMSYVQYYQMQYEIGIKNLDQPLLLHHTEKHQGGKTKEIRMTISLIPELCHLAGIADDIRSNFNVMKDISKITFLPPAERKSSILDLIGKIYRCEKAAQLLESWGVGLGPQPVLTAARVLQKDEIIFGHNKSVIAEKANWTNDTFKNPVLKAVNLSNWTVIGTERGKPIVIGLVSSLTDICHNIGIQVRLPHEIYLTDDSTENYLNAIKSSAERRSQIVVTILQSNRTDKYNAIKKLCCVELGIPSQVILLKTISRNDKLRPIAFKILLQINCKLGGALWRINIPVSKEGIMFVGIDVYHNHEEAHRSMVGFVSSTNKDCTSWFSVVNRQYTSQELMVFLKQSVRSALKKWHEINQSYPLRIMIYRDGIGEGCMNVVNHLEVKPIVDEINFLFPNKPLKLTYIITNKRISTRYFPAQNSERISNVPPGTVVDTTITNEGWLDFYMVSQNALQGTVCPIHYIVLYDKPHMKIDHLQGLSYKLSNLYYNWTGSVSIPAPCKYAHKLAQLAGLNIQDIPNDFLSDKLYYL